MLSNLMSMISSVDFKDKSAAEADRGDHIDKKFKK